jgi:hypothetical protein
MDPDTALFVSDLQDTNNKNSQIFKDKKSERSQETVEMKVFLTFLLDDGRIRIRIRASD